MNPTRFNHPFFDNNLINFQYCSLLRSTKKIEALSENVKNIRNNLNQRLLELFLEYKINRDLSEHSSNQHTSKYILYTKVYLSIYRIYLFRRNKPLRKNRLYLDPKLTFSLVFFLNIFSYYKFLFE